MENINLDSIEWSSRGSGLLRRLNCERIAVDPRLKLICSSSLPMVENRVNIVQKDPKQEEENWEEISMSEFERREQPIVDKAGVSPRFNDIDLQQQTDVDRNKPNSQQQRMGGSLRDKLQNVLFGSGHDFALLEVTPRILTLMPGQMDVLLKLFEPKNNLNDWNSAKFQLSVMNNYIERKFGQKACVFDCGFFDGVQKTHNKTLVDEVFADGQVTSLPYERNSLPSMRSLFTAASTISSWLALNSENVAIILAPSSTHLSVYLACTIMYCSSFATDISERGKNILTWYYRQLSDAETLTARLHRTFTVGDVKNVFYFNNLPRPQCRIIRDYSKLLELRDCQLESLKIPDIFPDLSLTGIVALPKIKRVTLHHIIVLRATDPEIIGLSRGYRPYFVIYNEKGQVIYSSMVHGIHSTILSEGPHEIPVNKIVEGGFVIRMYHVPFGKRGEFVFESRLHTGILAKSLVPHESSMLVLRLRCGDFDSVSSLLQPCEDFAIQLSYSEAMECEESINPIETDENESKSEGDSESKEATNEQPSVDMESISSRSVQTFDEDMSTLMEMFPSISADKIREFRHLSRNANDPLSNCVDLILSYQNEFEQASSSLRTDTVVEECLFSRRFNVEVTTCHEGSGTLRRIDIICRTHSDQSARKYEFLLAFYVQTSQSGIIVCYANDMRDFSTPSAFTQRLEHLQRFAAHQSSDDRSHFNHQRLVDEILARHLQSDENLHRDMSTHYSRSPYKRGASSEMLMQLPTHRFQSRKLSNKNDTQCLICRYDFQDGDLIKFLPCFHSYHAECINPWLRLNKICPTCQRGIDD